MKRVFVVNLLLIMICALSVFVGCDSGEDESSGADAGDPDDDDSDDGDNDNDDDDNDDDDDTPICDANVRPVVFCHGLLENGDAFSAQTQRFASNGYCADRIFAFDWNTLIDYADIELQAEKLDRFVDDVLAQTNAGQIDLVGHSMGGWLLNQYLQSESRQAKIAHAVVEASGWSEIELDTPIMNIYSAGDAFVPYSHIPGAQNVGLSGLDHLQVATGAETFSHLYPFFNDGLQPDTLEIVPESQIRLSGKIEVIGTNGPVDGMILEIYEVNPETGQRISESPRGIFQSENDGSWGDFDARPDTWYEFVCIDPLARQVPVHYYREPFVRSDNKVIFRVFPASDTTIGRLIGAVPLPPGQALFGFLSLNQAVVKGRDTLYVNGIDLAISGMAEPEVTLIAVFFLDGNVNGISDEQPLGGIFQQFLFMRGFDLRIPTSPPVPIVFEMNERVQAISNWSPATDGISIVVFN